MLPTVPAVRGAARVSAGRVPVSPAPGLLPGRLSALILSGGLLVALAGATAYGLLRKDITVVAGGRSYRVTTFRRTVEDVLRQARIPVRPDDQVIPARHAPVAEGQRIVVRPAVPVILWIDGKEVRVRSAASTVGALLRQRRLAMHPADKVFPPPATWLRPGLSVRVVRIRHRTVVERVPIPPPVRLQMDPAIPRGLMRVRAPGRPGIRERVFTVTTADRALVRRQLVRVRVVRAPLVRVLAVGAQVQVASRGELAGREMLAMVATAYAPWCCRGVDDVTALGMRAGYGVVAVDPRVIPLGSRLYIEGYGFAIAGDTGSRIKGHRIDLGFDTRREAIRFGRRPVRVYIIEKNAQKAAR